MVAACGQQALADAGMGDVGDLDAAPRDGAGDGLPSDVGLETGDEPADAGELEPIEACAVDVHQHLVPGNLAANATAAIALMDTAGIRTSLLLPPPSSGDPAFDDYDEAALAAVVAANPARFGLVSGGTSLNGRIHETVLAGRSPSVAELDDFEQDAERIADMGIAGFGEMAVLHLSYRPSHPFIAIPANHPMLLRLADVAARRALPIDVHLEILSDATAPRQPFFQSPPGGNNPALLPANLADFEELLRHNRAARFIWAHVGWDNTGEMTVTQLDALLDTHPNLYMSIKMLDAPGPVQIPENRPLDATGTIRPEWLTLLTEHPSRFVLGADEFILAPSGMGGAGAPSTLGTWSLLAQLPSSLARRIACENPRAIYRVR